MDGISISRQAMRRWIFWHSTFLVTGLILMLSQLYAQTLRVAVSSDDYPPFYYQQDEQLTGFSVELLQAVASELDINLQWQRLPWSRVVQHVANGKADVITVFYKNPERLKHFYFSSESYLRDAIVLLCAAPCKLNFAGDLNSLIEQPMAVVRDFSYGPTLDNAGFRQLAEVESDPMLFKLLINKRLSLGITSLITVQHDALLQQAQHKYVVLGPPLDYVDIYFAFSKQSHINRQWLALFDASLQRYKQTAAYQALLQRYQLLAASAQ